MRREGNHGSAANRDLGLGDAEVKQFIHSHCRGFTALLDRADGQTMPLLKSINPYIQAKAEPRSRTACGGLIAITVLPTLLLIATILWLHNWFSGNQGAIETTDVLAVNLELGLRLDRGDGQQLICAAASGCWYTAYYYRDQNGAERIDTRCPPQSVIEESIATAAATAERTGSDAFLPRGDDPSVRPTGRE